MANFYMRDIRAWKDSTLMLTFEERAYFDELLSLIYLYDGALPDNDDLICRAMPVNKKVHLRLKKRVIEEGLVSIENGFYFNSRATQELLKINSKSTQNKFAADKRWSKSLKNNKTTNANAMPIVKDESESENTPNGVLERETEFLAWQDVYPIRGNPVTTLKAFSKVLDEGLATLDELTVKAAEYAERKKGEPRRYIKSPKNWLEDFGWQDPEQEKDFDPIAFIRKLDAEAENANN